MVVYRDSPQMAADRAQDVKLVRHALAGRGITSLDDLVNRHASAQVGRLVGDEPLFATIGSETREHAPKPHKPPQADLYIDGARHDPSVINEFDSVPLYSTPGRNAAGDPALYSFTTRSGLHTHLIANRSQVGTGGSDDFGTNDPDICPELSYYYENDSGGGDYLQNGPGRAWSDLTRVGRGVFHLGDWNDIISSVFWCRWDISLYSDINYGGSQLYLLAGQTYFHLSVWGWNDQASSTANWGTRFDG